MQLTYKQKEALFRTGYVHIPGVVPQVMIDEALKAINYRLGEGIDPKQVPIFRSRSFTPEVQREAVITDLINKIYVTINARLCATCKYK